ncbi:MAG: ATP-binding protein, partial [Candidatus Omnitrophica bacterium]|nr:ATP-binding protein [Candidatus Omnitrophota bacterium]
AIMLSILQGIAQDAPDRSEDVDVKEVVSIIAGAINLENTVVLEIGMGASSARGNSSELLRILFNLLRNAGRAVKRKPGSVAIKTCAEGDRIIIKVSDSGPGMAVNEVNSFNGSRSVASTQEGFGHGVGLTVVRELTERNGGTVVLESEPGKGSVFTIKLPIGKATASTEPDTTRTTTSTNGASQLPRYGDNGTGPALPGTQPGNELGRHHFKPTPDEQVRFVKATGTSTAAEAVSGSDLKKLPGYSIENMLLNNERIVFGEALKYLDFSRNVPSDQLSRRGIFCLALIKAVRNTKKDPVALKRLIFELAVLLISEKSWFDYPFISISYEVHHYDDYKDVMAVCGLALVIANRFEPHNFVYPRTIENISSGYNDRDRNAIRLIGFFREEKYALPLIRRLANELDQKYDADPWHIDLNMAILDALEAINYESSEVRQEVLEALQGLGRRIKTRQTNIVKKRVEAVVKVLQAGEKPTNCLQNYERLTEEFNIFIRTHNVKQMKLLHALYGFKHYIPFLDRGGYEELGLRVGLYDPVDEAYGESYRTILREKLELVRIDYDSMLAKLRTGSSAARPARYRDRMRSASKTKEKASAAMPAPFNGMARD